MIKTFATKVLSTTLCLLLIILTGPFGAEVPVSAQEPAPAYSGQGAPLTAQELQGLAAPIALYPDALVAQILGGATFPDQIAAAANWLQQHPGLTGQSLLEAVNAQSWEPSVKALTQFPSVLGNMATNLSWTSALGEAYATQGADVMAAVQVLRAKAQAAGNLKSGAQITVVQQSPQIIVIQPVNPQVIYVPAYNPAVVYGYPYVVPGYSTAAVVTTGRDCIWSRHRCWHGDQRRLWLGLEFMELRLARQHGRLSRRRVLREHCLAWRRYAAFYGLQPLQRSGR